MATPQAFVEVCTAFDAESVCTATAWLPYQNGVLPTLSIEAAESIGMSIALLWAGAWVIRVLKKLLTQL